MKYILALFILAGSSPTFGHCNEELISPNGIDSLISAILGSLTTSNATPLTFQSQALEIVTGLTQEKIRGNSDASFVRRLVPIYGWRHFSELVDWQGYAYSEIKGWSVSRIYNSFWGRPINLRDADLFFVGLHHRAIKDQTWLNLVLGPIDVDEVARRNIITTVSDLRLAAGARTQTVTHNTETLHLLVIYGVPNKIEPFLFLKKLTARMQDRYLSKDKL